MLMSELWFGMYGSNIVVEISTSINTDELSFNDSINELHEYIAFNSSAYLTPSISR